MSEPRRVRFRHVIALGLIAGALAACGVKGDLEPPPAAKLAEPQPGPQARTKPQAQSEPSSAKVFSEQSVVRGASTPSIYPRMPPEAWSKGREYQAAPQPKTGGKNKEEPDEPFFLDGLL